MNTNSEKLLLKDEVFQIVGYVIEILNTLGHGTKVIDRITGHDCGLMLNYLRITRPACRPDP